MKAITVRQPAASQIAQGCKTLEVRSWPTAYRGPVLLCVGPALHGLPAGEPLAVVEIIDCRRFRFGEDESAALCDGFPGAWAWVLGKVSPVPPMAVNDSLGLLSG